MSQNNPNDVLADQIAKKLIDDNLVDKSVEKKFIKGLSQGSLKESDWKTFLEEVINQPKPDSNETEKSKH